MEVPSKRFSFDQSRSTVGKLIREVTLHPGDLIYIPRGVGHEAITSEMASVHITVGLEFYQWIELFKIAIEELENDAEFRKSMPPYFLNRKSFSESEKDHMKILLSKLNELVMSGELVGDIQNKFLAAQIPTYEGLFSTILNLDGIDVGTKIQVRQNVLYKITEEPDIVMLMFADKKISFPQYVKGALEVICNSATLSVGEIPHLDESSKILLVKVLAREGFVSLTAEQEIS
jgi:hypothetical protein